MQMMNHGLMLGTPNHLLVGSRGSLRRAGDEALQTNHLRGASIKCLEDTAFLRIPYATYQAGDGWRDL